MTAQQMTIISEDTSSGDLNFMEYLNFFFFFFFAMSMYYFYKVFIVLGKYYIE